MTRLSIKDVQTLGGQGRFPGAGSRSGPSPSETGGGKRRACLAKKEQDAWIGIGIGRPVREGAAFGKGGEVGIVNWPEKNLSQEKRSRRKNVIGRLQIPGVKKK